MDNPIRRIMSRLYTLSHVLTEYRETPELNELKTLIEQEAYKLYLIKGELCSQCSCIKLAEHLQIVKE
jgi:hypothetical protein